METSMSKTISFLQEELEHVEEKTQRAAATDIGVEDVKYETFKKRGSIVRKTISELRDLLEWEKEVTENRMSRFENHEFEPTPEKKKRYEESRSRIKEIDQELHTLTQTLAGKGK